MEELFIKMVMDAWHTSLKRTEDLLNNLSDDALKKETATGRNTGVYLLGHLAAVHDRMMALLGIGEPLRPDLFEKFVSEAENKNQPTSSIPDLKAYWKDVHASLNEKLNRLTPEEWFQKHTSVSEEDFAKELHRNRLNVVITRTNHLDYHRGQLIYLKEK